MPKNKYLKYATIISVLIFLIFGFIAYIIGVTAYISDSITIIIIVLLLYFMSNKLNLNVPVLIIIVFAFILHNCGIFGWYNIAPIPIQWDHVTHFVGIFAASVLVFQYLKQWMDKKFLSSKTIMFICIVFLAALGIGSIVETTEFVGYNIMGFGEGVFGFGQGDALPGQEISKTDKISIFGGGWFNTMWDLIYNMLGAVIGIAVMSFYEFKLKKTNSTS